jgi:hypothetical protein
VDFGDKKVAGWAGIMRRGSHVAAGFSVFRRRRLIEGSVGETYKPSLIFGNPNSFASQRVVGELFVEGFDVTHTKDGIQWHGYEDELLESIRRQIDSPDLPILDQADGYRARNGEEVVAVQVNLEHDFSVSFINDNEAVLQPMMRLIAALSLGERLARDAGVKNAGTIRMQANQILRTLASDRGNR